MPAIAVCPKCQCQLEVKLSFASGPKRSSQTAHQSVPVDDLGELIESINGNALSGRDLEFFESTKARFEQYGTKTIMSEKQMSWLRNLAGQEDF